MSTAFKLDPGQQAVKGRLVRLLVRLLRPLVRLLLRHGMSCQEFTEISRWVYVDVAMRDSEFALKSRSKQFKSRAAVITGLSRKEVLRLLDVGGPKELEEIQPLNRAARVMTGWTENAMFAEGRDKPKLLPIKGGRGSFHDLVRLYSGDVPPRAVLDELRRCGAVEIVDGDFVRLKRFSYAPESGDAEEIGMFEMVAGDLLETMDYNMRNNSGPGEGKPFREAYSANLPEQSLPEVRAWIRKELEGLSRRTHHFLVDHEDKVQKSGVKYHRAGLGLYYFES